MPANENSTSQDIPYSDSVLEITPATTGNSSHLSLCGVTPPYRGTTSHSLSASPDDNQPGNITHIDPALPVVTTENDG